MKKKYLLMPGMVQSFNDGEYHFISAKKLIDLYRVSPQECTTYIPGRTNEKEYTKLIKLYPRYSGNYKI